MLLSNAVGLGLLLLAFSPCAAKQSSKLSKTIHRGYGDGSDGGQDPSTLITIPLDAQLLQKAAGYGDGSDSGGSDPSTLITIPLDAQLLQQSKGDFDGTGSGDDPNLITIPLDAQLLQQSKGYFDGTGSSSGDDPNLITIPLDAQLLQKGAQPIKVDISKLQASYQQKLHTEEQKFQTEERAYEQAAHQLAKDEHTIAVEKQQLSKSEQQVTYWKTLGQKEETELQEIMKAEKYSAEHMMDKSTTGTRLMACLKTRDIAQMEGEKIQKENAALQGQVIEATNTKDMINQTLSAKISEIAAKATKDQANHKASFDKLQKEQDEILAQFAKMKEENAKIMEVKRLVEVEREQLRKQLEDITKKHEKVVKAHEGLKKAHEVLKKRHDDLESRAQTANATELSMELRILQGKHDDCMKNLTSINSQEKKIHDTEADLRLAAFKQGAKEADQKWSVEVKNATSQRDGARYAAQEADKKVAELRALADKETKGKNEAEVKLRQCRSSREKIEIELERVTKHTGEKNAFLQIVPSDWA